MGAGGRMIAHGSADVCEINIDDVIDIVVCAQFCT